MNQYLIYKPIWENLGRNMAYEKIVLDIEANNLLEPMIDFTQRPLKLKDTSKLWCINIRCIDTDDDITLIPEDILNNIDEYRAIEDEETLKEFDSMKVAPLNKETLNRLFNKTTEIIGHNLIKYDLPALKLFNMLEYNIGYPYYEEIDNNFNNETKINDKELVITDTLIWSKLLNADRYGGHSLKAFGKQGTDEKLDHDEFDKFSISMVVYCRRDTLVNLNAYNLLMEEKGGYEHWDKPYRLESKLSELVLRQELFGFDYDLELSHSNKIELDQLLKERYDKVTPEIPPKPLNKGEAKDWTPPAKSKKKDGTLSSNMIKFLEKIGATYNPLTDSYDFENKTFDIENRECVKETLPADIKDLAHLKWYLMELGWIPSEWRIRDLTRDNKKKILPKEKFLETVDRYVKDTLNGPFKKLRLEELELKPDITEKDLTKFLISQYNEERLKPIRVPASPPLRVGASKELCPNLAKLAEETNIPFIADIVEYYTYQHRRNSIAGGIDEETGEPSKGFESYVREDGRVSTPVDSNSTNTSR